MYFCPGFSFLLFSSFRQLQMKKFLYGIKCWLILGFIIPHAYSQNESRHSVNEKSLTILKGGAGDALEYSMDHKVVAITLTTGKDAPYTPQQIAEALDKNIFSGYAEVPIAVFIDTEPVPGSAGIVMGVFIRGYSLTDDYKGTRYFNPNQLKDCAGQIANKLKSPKRLIDKSNPLSADP